MSKKYEVYKVEEREFGEGKVMKKLVLQGEGDQYPLKNVAMWSDHPLFNTIQAGQSHVLEISVKDSTTPNPHGGFYKNRSVVNPTQATQNTNSPTVEQRLTALENAVFKDKPAVNETQEYPEFEDISGISF